MDSNIIPVFVKFDSSDLTERWSESKPIMSYWSLFPSIGFNSFELMRGGGLSGPRYDVDTALPICQEFSRPISIIVWSQLLPSHSALPKTPETPESTSADLQERAQFNVKLKLNFMLLKFSFNSPQVQFIFAGCVNTLSLPSEQWGFFPYTLITEGGKNQILLRGASFVFWHSPSSTWSFFPHINATPAMPAYKLLPS